MKTIQELLVDHDFFRGLSEEHLKTVAACGKLLRFQRNEYLAHEGEPANAFYLLRQGLVSIEYHTPQNGTTIVQTVKQGDIVGWSWLFPPHHWTGSVKARDDVAVIAFDGLCLREKCENDHSLGYFMMKALARVMTQRLRDTRLQVLDIYGRGDHA